MTPQETAQMQAMMGGNNFSPLALNALTNQAMGYLPDAQYMTPSQYGAFRTLPQMAYQQPVNQTPGFLKSFALTTNIGATHFYNPAVSPMQQRAEASRYVTDTTASVLSAMGGTAMDLGMLGLGLLPGLGMPMLAASLAGAMLPIHFQGPMEHIANTRALQRLTRGKIVSGNSIDAVMGSGFSTRAARSIDTHLYRRSLNDVLYDDEDYRKMLGEGIQAGMFDYANTPEQYKKILGNIRDNMSTLMEVAGSQDFEDAMKELKRLQDMGAQQGNFHSILRSENAYARMTGLSHSDLVNTYGQMGALEFAQRGLSNIQGSQVAMHNAAVVTMGQRNGTMSAAYVASKGGVSGMAQDMTTQSGEAIGKYQTHLLLAAIDPETGEIRKDFNLDNYTGSAAGLTRLMNDASRNASAIMTGPDAAIKQQKFNRSIPDLIQKLQNKEGSATLQLSKMAEIVGRNALQNRPGNFTRKDYMSAGLQTLGFKADSAQDFVNSIGDIEKQFEYERNQDMLKTLTEFRKSNRLWSRAWRKFTTTVGGYWDDLASTVSDAALRGADANALQNSGLLDVGALNANLVQSSVNAIKPGYQSLASRFNMAQDLEKYGNNFSAIVGMQNQVGRSMGIGYHMGDKGFVGTDASGVYIVDTKNGSIDCSGWITSSLEAEMKNFNKNNPNYFSDKAIKIAGAGGNADNIINRLAKAGGGLLDFGNTIDTSQLEDGMVVAIDTGFTKQERKEKAANEYNRTLGADHIVQMFRDKASGEWMVSESNGRGGVTVSKLSDWQQYYSKQYGGRAHFWGSSIWSMNAEQKKQSNKKVKDTDKTKQKTAANEEGNALVTQQEGQQPIDLRVGADYQFEGGENYYSRGMGVNKRTEWILANDKKVSQLNSTIARSQLSYNTNIKDLSESLGIDVLDAAFSGQVASKVAWDAGDTEDFEKSVRAQYAYYLQHRLKLSPEKQKEELKKFDEDQGYRSMVIGAVLSSDVSDSTKKNIKDRYKAEYDDRKSKVRSMLNKRGLEAKEGIEYADKNMLDSDSFTKISTQTDEFIKGGNTYEDAALIKSIAYLTAAHNSAESKIDRSGDGYFPEDLMQLGKLGEDIRAQFGLNENILGILRSGKFDTTEGQKQFFNKRFGPKAAQAMALYKATLAGTKQGATAADVSKGLSLLMKNRPISGSLAVQTAVNNLNVLDGVQGIQQDDHGNFSINVQTLRQLVKEGKISGDQLIEANKLIDRAGGLNSKNNISKWSSNELAVNFGYYDKDTTGKRVDASDALNKSVSAAEKTLVDDAIKKTADNSDTLVSLGEQQAMLAAFGNDNANRERIGKTVVKIIEANKSKHTSEQSGATA